MDLDNSAKRSDMNIYSRRGYVIDTSEHFFLTFMILIETHAYRMKKAIPFLYK